MALFFNASLPSGEVVYHKKTSRVYNMHTQCGEERGHCVDGIVGKEEVTVTRCLGERSATFSHTKDMRTGQEKVSRSRHLLREDEEDDFEQEWMAIAMRNLPPYTTPPAASSIEQAPSRFPPHASSRPRPALMPPPPPGARR